MSRASKIGAELWSNYACAGGSRLAYLGPVIVGGENAISVAVEGDDSMSLSVPNTPEVQDAAAAGVDLVVRITDPVQGVSEWRIDQVTDAVGPDDGRVFLRGASPLAELTDCGPIWEEDTAGIRRYNLGTLVELTPEQIWDEVIQPFLTATGYTWVGKGTFNVTDLLTIECNRQTPRALLNTMAGETDGEFRLRRNGETGYLLDFVARLGASATVVRAEVGRNLRAIERTGERQDYANVVVAYGDVPTDGFEPATISDNVWEVWDVDAAKVYLRDPSTLENPVFFEGQFATGGGTDDGPLYLELPDLTTVRVVKGRAPVGLDAYVEMPSSGHGITIGQHVVFRRTSAGLPVTELEAGDRKIGRPLVKGDLQLAGLRGERNWSTNPTVAGGTKQTVYHANPTSGVHWIFTRNADSLPTGWTSNPNAGSGTSTVSLNSLPPNLAIQAGWLISDRFGPMRRITTSVTADGSGNATVEFDTGSSYPGPFRHDWVPTRVQTVGKARFSSFWSDQTGNDQGRVFLKELPVGFRWEYGDRIARGTVGGTILNHGVVGGDGFATIFFTQNGEGSGNYFANDDVTITPVPVEDFRGITSVMISPAVATVGVNTSSPPPQTQSLSAPVVKVRVASGVNTQIWGSARVQYFAVKRNATIVTGTPSGGDQYTPAALSVVRSDTNTILGYVWDSAFSLTAGNRRNVTLRAQAEISEPRDIELRILPPSTSAPDHRLVLSYRWVTLTVGPQPDVPFVVGSHANRLWLTGSRVTERLSRDRVGYVIRYRDLAYLDEYEIADERLTLGGTIRLVSRERGIDTEARVVQIRTDLLDPDNSEIVLDTRPPKLTRLLAGL
jgi:hypothetical protein